jgi:hypothetical protein
MATLSPDDARRYLSRWTLVNEQERRELQATSVQTKFRQLAALMQSATIFADSDARLDEDDDIRARWQKIRLAFGV